MNRPYGYLSIRASVPILTKCGSPVSLADVAALPQQLPSPRARSSSCDLSLLCNSWCVDGDDCDSSGLGSAVVCPGGRRKTLSLETEAGETGRHYLKSMVHSML